MNWTKEASSERFEELKRFATDWVVSMLAGTQGFVVEDLLENIKAASTVMGIKGSFEAIGLKKQFEDMMIEFFR